MSDKQEHHDAEVAELREQLRDMTARALGHAYASEMAEGGEDIQAQELAYERRQHAGTLATLRRYECALTSIAKRTCCAGCQEAQRVAAAALAEPAEEVRRG
jgi:hypothetical protein